MELLTSHDGGEGDRGLDLIVSIIDGAAAVVVVFFFYPTVVITAFVGFGPNLASDIGVVVVLVDF